MLGRRLPICSVTGLRQRAPLGQFLKRFDQIVVAALGLGARLFQPCEDILDPVQAGENDAHPLDSDRRPVAVLTHQCLGGMGELGEPLQAEKAARPLDCMNEAEDGVEHLPVVRLLLEPHEIDVELVEPLAGLGQEFCQ